MKYNSLAPGRSYCDFKNVIFNLALLIGNFKSSYDNVLRWMSQALTDDKSTLVQVMAWCRQASSHYLNQCWPRSPTPYGVTRPQWDMHFFSKRFDNWNKCYGEKEVARLEFARNNIHIMYPDYVAWRHQAIIWTNVDLSSIRFSSIHLRPLP